MKNFLVFFLILIGIKSFACRCDDPGTTKEAFGYTPFIIHGRVLNKSTISFKSTMNEKTVVNLENSLKNDDQKLSLLNSEFILKIEVEILFDYKNNMNSDTITLFTTRTGASCGFTRFEIGQEYLIYASSNSYAYQIFNSKTMEGKLEKEDTYWTSHCTRTYEYNEGEAEELRKLADK